MDSSLQILVGCTSVFAGAVAYLALLRGLGTRRAALAAGGTALTVAASFAFMVVLAHVAVPATMAFAALATGAVAYFVFRPDLGTKRAALAAAGAATVVAAAFLLVVYLAVIAFVGALGVYVLLRTRIRIGPAFVLMGTTLSGLLAAAGLAFWVSLTYTM